MPGYPCSSAKGLRSSRVLMSAAIAAAFLAVAGSAQAASYTFQTLNNPGDLNFNQLLGINNAGTIAGYFGDGTVVPNNGYTLIPPSAYNAENVLNSTQTQVIGINNPGPNAATVGFFTNPAGNTFGFVNQGGNVTPVSDPLTPITGTATNNLLGVNDHGIAAGFYNDISGNAHGYVYNITTTVFTPVTPTFAATAVTATGINNAGLISGFYTDAAGNFHGFLDNNGTFTSLDDPNGSMTMLLGLNNADQVVGSFVAPSGITEGLIYNLATNTWQTISDPNASANPAFNVTGTTVNGINDLGQLVGFYSDGTHVNGFLATPVPEPATLGLLLPAAVGLIARRRRAKQA